MGDNRKNLYRTIQPRTYVLGFVIEQGYAVRASTA